MLGVVPLLRAEGCEDEAQIGLVLPEDRGHEDRADTRDNGRREFSAS